MIMQQWVVERLVELAGYGLGSLNAALLGAALGWWPDPRLLGSGNAGATNMLRLQGVKKALIVLLFDFAKAFVPMWWARQWGLSEQPLMALWLLLVLGHCYPIFFRFQGGKGVATAFGGLVAFAPNVALGAAIIFGLCLLWSRFVSLSALVAAAVSMGWLTYQNPTLASLTVALWLCLAFQHRENIRKLLKGEENALGAPK